MARASSPSKRSGAAKLSGRLRRVFRLTARERSTVRRLERALPKRVLVDLERARGQLDATFIEEKAMLLRDTLIEVQRHRRRTPNTLLQRNVWSSLDALALHLDHTGFTRAFQRAAGHYLRDYRLDEPETVSLELGVFLRFLGVSRAEAARLDMPMNELHELFELAEEWKGGHCGRPYIMSKEFSFRRFFQRFCGRPDRILEIHHSPQAKATVAVLMGVANILAYLFGVIPLVVITVVVMVIVGCMGC